jgi:hypothetical protein
MVCADPDNQIVTILLTNRVYPIDNNTAVRRRGACAQRLLAPHSVALMTDSASPPALQQCCHAHRQQPRRAPHRSGRDPRLMTATYQLAPSGVSGSRRQALEKAYEDFRSGAAVASFPSTAVIPFNYTLFKQCDPAWGSDIMVPAARSDRETLTARAGEGDYLRRGLPHVVRQVREPRSSAHVSAGDGGGRAAWQSAAATSA